MLVNAVLLLDGLVLEALFIILKTVFVIGLAAIRGAPSCTTFGTELAICHVFVDVERVVIIDTLLAALLLISLVVACKGDLGRLVKIVTGCLYPPILILHQRIIITPTPLLLRLLSCLLADIINLYQILGCTLPFLILMRCRILFRLRGQVCNERFSELAIRIRETFGEWI